MEFILTHPDEGIKNIVILFDGVVYEADSSHIWWDEIVSGALEDDARILDLVPIRTVQQPSEEIPFESEGVEPELIEALDIFFTLNDLDPLEMSPEDYSEQEIKALRRIYDHYDVPVCKSPDCRFCYGPRI